MDDDELTLPPGASAQHVLRAMLDAVIVVGLDGRIRYTNAAARELLGMTAAELAGRPVVSVFASEEMAMRTTRMQAPRAGLALRREEVQLQARDGTTIPVSVIASAVLDERGTLSAVVLVARDLRQIHALLAQVKAAKDDVERQLDEARRQLLHAERLATLGTLAGGVGHELNNIVAVHRAAVFELARLGDAVPADVVDDLRVVDDHLANHARRLLNLARPGPDTVEPLDLVAVVRSTVDMLNGAGRTKYVTVEVAAPDGPLPVRLNRARIEQILVNLIGNAADALGDRSSGGRIEVRARRAAGRAVCEVADNGSGIPPEVLGKIFQPFFTTKPADRGTGLGLSVVQQIVESYGGQIRVASEPGRGSTFTFDLPLETAASGQADASGTRSSSSAG
jgi:PAS domain S-box-containing protein